MWKAGIVGCGIIAGAKDVPTQQGAILSHAQAYYRHPQFKLVAVMEPDDEKRLNFQRNWDVSNGYQSVEAMLKSERLDVISICSPKEFHYAQAIQILSAELRPKLLFIEKPVCLLPDEFSHLTDFAQQVETTVIVNHPRRFDPVHQQIRSLIQSGTMGRLISGRGVYYGGWMNVGTHLVDTLLMVLSVDTIIVNAIRLDSGRGSDHNLKVWLRAADAKIVLDGFDESWYQLFEIELRFSLGRIIFYDFGSTIIIEQVVVNNIGERVLVPALGSPLHGNQSPLSYPIDAIADHFQKKTGFQQLGVDLSSAALTMNTVWQALHITQP